MTTLTVNIEDKKTEKAVKAVLEALGLNYEIDRNSSTVHKPQTVEQYNTDLERGLSEIESGKFTTASDLKVEARKW